MVTFWVKNVTKFFSGCRVGFSEDPVRAQTPGVEQNRQEGGVAHEANNASRQTRVFRSPASASESWRSHAASLAAADRRQAFLARQAVTARRLQNLPEVPRATPHDDLEARLPEVPNTALTTIEEEDLPPSYDSIRQ